MPWAESGRTKSNAQRAVLSALFFLGYTAGCWAQSEPPLTVQLAGSLPSASTGCDPGLAGGRGLYGNLTTPGRAVPGGVGTSTTSDLGVPIGSTPSAGENVPLYSNPLAGDNQPLYSVPNPGSNAPLFSNSTLFGTSSLYSNSNLSGGTFGASPVANVGPTLCHSGIPVGEWLLYPSIRLYSTYSNNFFLSPTGAIDGFGFGATPTLTAQWTNGIHTTTIYADVDTQRYPADNMIDTFDRKVTFTQKYSPLPDLTFTVLGDYTHTTITSSLTNSIPDVITTPVTTPTRLPNGDIELPNGEIISPTGQIVGHVNPVSANGISIVNPSDVYTATATAIKIFNRGILTLSGSAAQTDYQFVQGTGPTSFTSFTTNTFREDGAFWLGPSLYAYSNGVYSMRNTADLLNPNSDAYNGKVGIGTRQFGLVRGSAYFGYQGSNADGSGSAGGLEYGGKISYYPTLVWTVTAAVDETINHAQSNGVVSTQALAVNSPEQIPLSTSTRITHSSLETQYQIAPQWSASGNFSYTQIDYYGSPRLDDAWQAGVTLDYEIWRNMTLTWEYNYTNIVSNAPGNSAKRDLVMMSANYRF